MTRDSHQAELAFPWRTCVPVVAFAVAFAWVESSVVVYLREIYYPEGFTFPLKAISQPHVVVELVREFATIIMLLTVGILAGRSRWERFAHFAIAFGVWDIFYYVWLLVAIAWPSSLLELDILFLLPLPWIGPVIAPVLISLLLIAAGCMIVQVERSRPFRPHAMSWPGSVAGCALILWTFMADTNAGLHGMPPEPYPYGIFAVGMTLLVLALGLSFRSNFRSRVPAG